MTRFKSIFSIAIFGAAFLISNGCRETKEKDEDGETIEMHDDEHLDGDNRHEENHMDDEMHDENTMEEDGHMDHEEMQEDGHDEDHMGDNIN